MLHAAEDPKNGVNTASDPTSWPTRPKTVFYYRVPQRTCRCALPIIVENISDAFLYRRRYREPKRKVLSLGNLCLYFIEENAEAMQQKIKALVNNTHK
jgi:hypothetical protein